MSIHGPSNFFNFFKDTPHGKDLPIPCMYQFGPGDTVARDLVRTVTPRWEVDLPEGFTVEFLHWDDPEVAASGLRSAPLYVNAEGQWAYEPTEGMEKAAWRYLRNPEGDIVATWDEGRWWTPEEGELFHLMLTVPATIEVADMGHGEFGRGRGW